MRYLASPVAELTRDGKGLPDILDRPPRLPQKGKNHSQTSQRVGPIPHCRRDFQSFLEVSARLPEVAHSQIGTSQICERGAFALSVSRAIGRCCS